MHDAFEMILSVAGSSPIIVDAEDDRVVGIAHRRGDQHPLGTGLEVLGRGRVRAEHARGLDDDIDVEVGPGKVGRVALGEHLDAVSVDDELVTVEDDGARVRAVDRVVLEQVREHLGVRQVVDGNDVDTGDVLLQLHEGRCDIVQLADLGARQSSAACWPRRRCPWMREGSCGRFDRTR